MLGTTCVAAAVTVRYEGGVVRAALCGADVVAVMYRGETMKLIQWSWLLGMLSYVIGGVFRRSGSPLGEMSLVIQGLAIFLLVILPAGIGAVLGAMSLKRKEVKAWWAISFIVLNIAMVLTGILLLFPG